MSIRVDRAAPLAEHQTRFAFSIAAIAASLTLFLGGCGYVRGKISQNQNASSAVDDYLLSFASVGGAVPADGTTSFSVTVTLEHSDHRTAVGVVPTLEVATGVAVTSATCTASNVLGQSTCSIRATTAGTRQMRVSNIPFDLRFFAVFTSPVGGSSLGHVVSSSTWKGSAAGGYTVDSTVGQTMRDLKGTAPGGYTIESSFRGAVQ